ncbi:MAG TPA: UDP-N-acetylmuramate dehydrogenase [Firmicutes bacterium]|nr:UDP-N-acetylmuramate dehydrogenase [Bacillota bacterium]
MVEGVARALAGLVGPENVRIAEPLSRHTSFRIGGPADCFVTPRSEAQVEAVLSFCLREGIPYFILGRGSNLLVKDGGLRAVVIQLGDRFAHYRVERSSLWAQVGITLRRLADLAASAALSGLEFAGGIPGTLGGAIVMNAGAYGGEIKDVLVEAEVLDLSAGRVERRRLTRDDLQFTYRSSLLQRRPMVVLSARFRLTPGEPGSIYARMSELWRRRAEKQPLELPSAGSIFKRPPGRFVGPMIQELGLPGTRVGGAEISRRHAGFIVNRGHATARDVLDLITLIQQRVKDRFGVELEPEIRIAGD